MSRFLPLIFIAFMSISFPVKSDQKYSVNILDEGSEFNCTAIAFWSIGDSQYREPMDEFKNFNVVFLNKMQNMILEKLPITGSLINLRASEFINLEKDWMHLNKGNLGIEYVVSYGYVFNVISVFENGKVVWAIGNTIDPNKVYFHLATCKGLNLDIRKK